MLIYYINSSGADSNYFSKLNRYSMATNALVPCIDRSSAAMILTGEKMITCDMSLLANKAKYKYI